jgi:hypothetical protein
MANAAVGITLVLTIATEGAAQLRRSATPENGGPMGPAPTGIPRNARHPYAGVWQGVFHLDRAPDGDGRIPVVMVFDVTDSVKSTYAGFTVLPNGGRAPHLETSVAKGVVEWKQSNSGGGFWVYTGHFVGQDSVAGTVVLKDWPQLPAGEKAPTGTFALKRRAPGA